MMALWSLGQGMAVRVRNWVEEAIKELILYQKTHFGREIEEVYSFHDLRRGRLQAANDRVAMAGEEETEHSHTRYWYVPVRESAVKVAERLAEEVGRRYERRKDSWQMDREQFKSYTSDSMPDLASSSLETFPAERAAFQEAWLRHAALDPAQEPVSWQRIICNLLVLEKPPGKVRAFRFASPGLKSLRAIRDEKRNLLLLYGWLRQEKPFRMYQGSVRVYWAHLMDRQISKSQEFFFGGQVLECRDFWEYLQVPYDLLLKSLEIAGQDLQKHIRDAVCNATPESIRNLAPDTQG